MDPTRIRARKFNTGKGANQSAGGDNSIWTETPEQKRKRLENQVMGVAAPDSGPGGDGAKQLKKKEDEETARRIREHTVSEPSCCL